MASGLMVSPPDSGYCGFIDSQELRTFATRNGCCLAHRGRALAGRTDSSPLTAGLRVFAAPMTLLSAERGALLRTVVSRAAPVTLVPIVASHTFAASSTDDESHSSRERRAARLLAPVSSRHKGRPIEGMGIEPPGTP